MEIISILPADTYTVHSKMKNNSDSRKIITMLYQPIIGYEAVSLYFTLIDDYIRLYKKNIKEYTHHHLMSTMLLKLDTIVKSRKKLEAVGLLKTYYKKDTINHYIYVLFEPISAYEFLNHPILNVTLYNNLGKTEYESLVEYFKETKISTKDYIDITSSFKDTFSPVSGNAFENIDIIKEESNKIKIDNIIDFNMLISSIPNNMISNRCFTEDIKELINDLAYTYEIDNINMQGLVRNSINEKGLIDKQELRKNVRNFYQFENDGKLPTFIYTKQPNYLKSPKGDNSKWAKMVYTFESVHPYDYLRSMYKTGKPSLRDIKIIESLLVDLKLTPGVVNVLISYVLKINNQKLNKNYIDTIAGQWKRLNIETVEEAMRICEKEHKKIKKKLNENDTSKKIIKNKTNEELPDWFNKELKNEEMNDLEKEELDKLLAETLNNIDNF